jgi:hypothetical protein
MKITKRQLRKIIREEKQKLITESRVRKAVRRRLMSEAGVDRPGRGKSVQEIYAEIMPGDVAEVVSGEKSLGYEGEVDMLDPSANGAWVLFPYDPENDAANAARWQHVRVLQPVDGRSPVRVGDNAVVRGGRKAPRGFAGVIDEIIVNAMGRYVLITAQNGEANWASAKQVEIQ